MVYSKETQTEPAMIKDISMQTEDPCIFLQGTQTDHTTVDTAVQTDVEEDVRLDCIIQEAAKAIVQTDPMETHD